MTTPINARDILLQQTSPRVINVASNYITLVSPNLEARYSADNNPVPSIIEITTILSGNLQGQVVFEITGLLPNTQLVLDTQNPNKLLLDPNTFATDSVVVTAKLTFQGIEYISVPVTAYRNYTSIVTRLSRAFDNVSADVNGNNYTLPATNTLELYNGTTKLTTDVVFGPATTTKSGLTCTVNSTTGVITFSQTAANSWITDQETFTFTATRNFIPYTVSYSINKIREGGTGIDATPPPTPTNFTASAAINTIVISHDTPTYTQGSGHQKTILYGKVFNTGDILTPFNPAEVIAEFTGSVYTLASEPGTTWRLWAKWRSNDGFLSTMPAGGTNGITVTTGQDVGKLLEVLSGEITESQLYSTLISRIDLIDTPNTGLVDKTSNLVSLYGTTASAAESALVAGQAKADAIIAKAMAEGASTEAIQAKVDAIIAQGIAEGSAITANTEAGIATAAKNSAQSSETNASQYANAALASASDAASSASTAATESGLATAARNATQGFETNASQYANAALASASDAASSASTAATQAGLATVAKNGAEGSATNASQYANAALASALDAASSASTAVTESGLATDAKNAAQGAETSASQYANAALVSASDAASSASTAATESGLATSAKNAAQGAETSASQYANAALVSASDAASSASTAATESGLATAAKNAAQGAETSASQYATAALSSATDAAGSASTAATESGLATAAKNAAEGASTAASQYANTALSSATDAAGSASTAATQAGLATDAKNAATLSETSASISATAAATSASNAAGSASTATTQAGLATSAKDAANGFSTSASQSATAAATSASNAAGSASTATTQAGIATTAKNAAGTSETNAGVSATNSATSATNAAGSATNAAASASSAATSLLQVQSTIRGTSLGLPLEQWVLNGQGIATITDGKVGTKALRLSGNFGYPNQGNYVPLDKTKKYRIKFWARPSSNAAGTLYFSLRQFIDDAGGTTGLTNGGRSPYKPSGQSRAAHIAAYGDTWGEYNYVWTSADWQAATKFVQPEFLDNYSGQVGYWDIQGFTFTDVTQVEELTSTVQTLATTTAGADGVTAQYTVKTNAAGHVAGFGLSSASNAAGAATSSFGITADKFFIAPPATVSATAPTTNLYNGYTWVDTSVTPNVTKYRSGTSWVTTPPILPFVVQATPVTGTGTVADPQFPAGVYIDAAFIKNATITTAKIAALAVGSAQIADAAITNAKINDLNASKITAGTISADRIGASSITAAKLSVTDLAAINANMGTVTAGKMQSTDNKFVIDLTNKFISITT